MIIWCFDFGRLRFDDGMNPLAPARLAAVVFAASLAVAAFSSVQAATASDAPRPWPADQFLPVTEARIAALPAAEQPAWRAYWAASQKRRELLPPFDSEDHSPTTTSAGPPVPSTYSQGLKLNAPAAWYASEEARTIADHVVHWQVATGGWVKIGDYARDPGPKDAHHDAWSVGTFDNDSTIYELRFLARVISAGGEGARANAWRESFRRGLAYVFDAQYPNGGFPQIYPLVGGYHDAITFNDDAMVHIIDLLRDLNARKPEFAFVPEADATEAGRRVERAIQCILTAQLHGADGHRTAWGQQHDALTLQPCAARNFEPMSECSSESARLVQFLMGVAKPTPAIVTAVEDALRWFPARAIHGMIWNRNDDRGSGLVPKAGAPDLWARFYEIGTGRPIFGDRDRTIHYVFGELSHERRLGYAWYRSDPASVYPAYEAWKKRQAAPPAVRK
jgi:PelA/Pel-15E family pectate lyase